MVSLRAARYMSIHTTHITQAPFLHEIHCLEMILGPKQFQDPTFLGPSAMPPQSTTRTAFTYLEARHARGGTGLTVKTALAGQTASPGMLYFWIDTRSMVLVYKNRSIRTDKFPVVSIVLLSSY